MCPSLIEIGSKTAEKNSAQTNRQTNTTKIMVTWPWTKNSNRQNGQSSLGMWWTSNPNLNVVGFCRLFANLKSDRFSDSFLRQIQLSFWKAYHYSLQSAI